MVLSEFWRRRFCVSLIMTKDLLFFIMDSSHMIPFSLLERMRNSAAKLLDNCSGFQIFR